MNETRRAILDALDSGPIGGPKLAADHDISRAAVWKHVEELRAAGFEIESGSNGYTLTGIPEYNEPALEFGLDAPFTIEFHETIDSTNRRAREVATEGATDVAVVAAEQTGGRGRLDREWASPNGGIWLSVLCRPEEPPVRAPLFTLAASVSIARAAREAGVDARIKWPNDVVVPRGTDGDYNKLAGVLTEMEGEPDRINWLVVGAGINANLDASAVPAEATTLREECGDVDRRVFVQRLLEEFDRFRTDLDAAVSSWLDLSMTIGQQVRVERTDETITGTAIDVTANGALVLDTDSGRKTVAAGDCEHLRPV